MYVTILLKGKTQRAYRRSSSMNLPPPETSANLDPHKHHVDHPKKHVIDPSRILSRRTPVVMVGGSMMKT
jgi:hypothetical protein